MMRYLDLLPTLMVILAVFGLVYCPMDYAGLRLRGAAGVWLAWVVYLHLVIAGCVYRLSGFGSGSPDLVTIPYYAAIALGAIGFPLWFSSVVLLKLAARKPPVYALLQVLGAWIGGVAIRPSRCLQALTPSQSDWRCSG